MPILSTSVAYVVKCLFTFFCCAFGVRVQFGHVDKITQQRSCRVILLQKQMWFCLFLVQQHLQLVFFQLLYQNKPPTYLLRFFYLSTLRDVLATIINRQAKDFSRSENQPCLRWLLSSVIRAFCLSCLVSLSLSLACYLSFKLM